jgi:hypothetical protein
VAAVEAARAVETATENYCPFSVTQDQIIPCHWKGLPVAFFVRTLLAEKRLDAEEISGAGKSVRE